MRQPSSPCPDSASGRTARDLKRLLNLNYLTYTNKTRAAGIHDLPALSCNTSVLPDYIALSNHPGDFHHTPLTAVAFYLYDSDFDGKDGLYNSIYYGDEKRQRYFRDRFAGVRFFISPDMSQLGDIDDIENHYRMKKSRVVAIWLAMELDAVVIPHITFPTLASIDFALDGLEDCSVVAFSTKGYVNNQTERAILKESVKYTVDSLNLRAIVVYDACATDDCALEIFSYAIDRGVEVVIPSNMLKERNASKKKSGEADEE